ncbi:hypothetical protein TGAM01_v208967 [Trichoderma gamsii]|uniref:Aminotransferase class I/classII large domain-containing protein n=1 Tax=Trichoderma gamsii TaxID=398673 RepID=A0A2P4ZCU6_9HYPO|nr:hypothetical protein TGAM01_v208967 [Trichoderma gamsii]PON22093.1 hypothetical protein TGAM01_v208967 [Trichoderma gamsii]
MSHFASLSEVPPDAAFALIDAYKADHSPLKVDLSPGFYRDEDARPWILPSVQKAKQELLTDPTANHEHIPILGHIELLDGAQKLVFDTTPEDASTIASIQTIAGTGANHLGALFLVRKLSNLEQSGFRIPVGSITKKFGNLHIPISNVGRRDFTKEQWKAVAGICEQKRLIPFFDLAYQGFATGDLGEDAWSSFSKSFGLYGERIVAARFAPDERPHEIDATKASKRTSKTPNSRRMGSYINRFNITEIGMFSMTNMQPNQIRILREEYHVYLLPSGRISMTGCWC